MRTKISACFLVLICFTNSASAGLVPLIEDNFNSYNNGSIIGQGGWESYNAGEYFLVQDTMTFEGSKALYNYDGGDCIIGKKGALLTDGRQAVYVRLGNSSWNGYAQVRISKDLWASPGHNQNRSFIAVNFNPNGQVAYYDHVAQVSHTFATYNYNEWTLLETEWQSNATARYRINSGTWTNWEPVAYSELFNGFDYVGLEASTGSGSVYFDTLSVPEPSTWVLLVCGLITLLIIGDQTFFLRRK